MKKTKSFFFDKPYILNSIVNLAMIAISSFLGVEILSQFLVQVNKNLSETSLKYQKDAILGWRLLDGEYQQRHPDFPNGSIYTIKSGNRVTNALRYTDNLRNQKTINMIGDSFTFGIGVSDSTTSSAYLQGQLPHHSVVNLGVSGYDLAHYIQIVKKINSDYSASKRPIVVVNILLANDFLTIQKSYHDCKTSKPYIDTEHTLRTSDYALIHGYKPACKAPVSLQSPNILKQSIKAIALRFMQKIPVTRRSLYDETLLSNYPDEALALKSLLDQLRSDDIIVMHHSLQSSGPRGLTQYEYDLFTIISQLSSRQSIKNQLIVQPPTNYWKTETHPNHNGNKKIAETIYQLLQLN